MKDHPYLQGEPGQRVSLGEGFVADIADTLRTFFDEFDKQVQAYMDRTWRKNQAPE